MFYLICQMSHFNTTATAVFTSLHHTSLKKVFVFFTVCINILFPVDMLDAHVCLLKRRRDSTTGAERWSLPSEERCYCTSVLAPKCKSVNSCAEIAREKRVKGNVLWFIDDPQPLTNRSNWNVEMLDLLLERVDFCSKLL